MPRTSSGVARLRSTRTSVPGAGKVAGQVGRKNFGLAAREGGVEQRNLKVHVSRALIDRARGSAHARQAGTVALAVRGQVQELQVSRNNGTRRAVLTGQQGFHRIAGLCIAREDGKKFVPAVHGSTLTDGLAGVLQYSRR